MLWDHGQTEVEPTLYGVARRHGRTRIQRSSCSARVRTYNFHIFTFYTSDVTTFTQAYYTPILAPARITQFIRPNLVTERWKEAWGSKGLDRIKPGGSRKQLWSETTPRIGISEWVILSHYQWEVLITDRQIKI